LNDRNELEARLETATRLARSAGAIQRERYESRLQIDTKSASIDLVTEVDRACEALIVDGIRAAHHEDAILAEEGGDHVRADNAATGYRWVIDPLDGTVNFAHGFPRFCVSIAVEAEEGESLVGVVYDPLLDECFTALRGAGARLGDRLLAVSGAPRLGDALVATGFSYDVHSSDHDNLSQFGQMVKTARGIRRDGSAALDLCYVAAGRLDAYWEFKLHPWDVAAGRLIVEEAGGRTSNVGGGPAPASGAEIVSSNGRIHEEVLAVLRANDSRRSRFRCVDR
jgi:myo-inositol-1(or 4)-monophosphatase